MPPIGRYRGALAAQRPDDLATLVIRQAVNRLCASELSAVVSACHAVPAGEGDLFVAGGHRVHVPGAASDS